MSRFLAPFVLLLAGLVTLGWWLPNRPVDVGAGRDAGGMFNSLSFAPYRANESPLTERFPTVAEADADMALLVGRTRAVRTYAAIEGNYETAALARKHGLKLWQGIWLGADRAKNEQEIARGIALANRYPDTIERVVVGNEVLLRRDLPPAELIADIDRVRAAVKQPVAYADVWEFWTQFPEVARHVDVVLLHLLPYWEDTPTGIDQAVGHVREVYHRMAVLFPGKTIGIGETGWPSRGRERRDALPSRVNEARFLNAFMALARQEGFDYNFIEAFDQVWKYKSEGVVGANWGLFTPDRAAKFPAAGPVAEDPDWPEHAALSVGLGLALLVFALKRPGLPKLPPSARFRLAILAMALGGALGFAVAETAPELYDAHLFLAGVVNLSGQVALAVLLLVRVERILAGEPAPPPRTGAAATEAVRTIFHPHWPRLHAEAAFEDLSFVFAWTAALLQALLVFDPRYREFPLASFAVPLVAVLARALARDLPVGGGGREEAVVGGALALGAVVSLVQEGLANGQSLRWNAAALVLAAPALLRLARRARDGREESVPSATGPGAVREEAWAALPRREGGEGLRSVREGASPSGMPNTNRLN